MNLVLFLFVGYVLASPDQNFPKVEQDRENFRCAVLQAYQLTTDPRKARLCSARNCTIANSRLKTSRQRHAATFLPVLNFDFRDSH